MASVMPYPLRKHKPFVMCITNGEHFDFGNLQNIHQIAKLNNIILHKPYSQKFLRCVYFAVKSLIRIFKDKILWMSYNEANFQLKMMLSCEFSCTKFSLLIDHLRKPWKLHATKISSYTV